MKRLNGLLSSGGMAFIRVPNFNCLWRKIFKSKWIWFQPKNHLFHFSIGSLTELLGQSGFEVVEIKSQSPHNRYTNRAYQLAVDTMRKYFKASRSLRDWVLHRYSNMVAVEIFCVARKKI